MELIHIFNPASDPDEGLWAIKYEGESLDAFRKAWDDWSDAEWMVQFCMDNLADMRFKFGYAIEPEEAANELMDEAEELKKYLYELGKKRRPGETLQFAFQPLNNNESNLRELQLSKGKAEKRKFKNPKLRIYAVRVSANTFVVTGAAIKLTDYMNERKHTRSELVKMNKGRDWLKSENICYPEDLNEI